MQKKQLDDDLPPGVHRFRKDGKVVPKRFVVRGAGMIDDLGMTYEVKAIVSARDHFEALLKLPKLREAAIARKRAKLAEAARPVEPEMPTLGAFAKSWLERRARELKASTLAFYGLALRQHILPTLGNLRIDQIRRLDVAEWMDRQVGVSDSVNARFRVLRTVLEAATDRYELPRNPAKGMKARPRTEPKKKKALAASDLESLLAAVRVGDADSYPLILLLARTGCRFGEATALKWSDIDHAAGTITIERAQVRGAVGKPKNGKTRHPVMTPDLAAALRELRERHEEENRPELAEGWLFMTRPRDRENTLPHERRHLQPSSIRKVLARACKRAGITQHVSPHCLRHTTNNQMRRNDPLGIVTRTQIGHADADMTETYSDVGLDERVELLRRAFPAAFNGRSNGRSVEAPPEAADLH